MKIIVQVLQIVVNNNNYSQKNFKKSKTFLKIYKCKWCVSIQLFKIIFIVLFF